MTTPFPIKTALGDGSDGGAVDSKRGLYFNKMQNSQPTVEKLVRSHLIVPTGILRERLSIGMPLLPINWGNFGFVWEFQTLLEEEQRWLDALFLC